VGAEPARRRQRQGRPAPPSDPHDPAAALERALRILAAAGQTTARLRARLRRAGYADDAVEPALRRLTELRYIDDRAYAVSRMRRRIESGRGRRVIAAELRQRGVPDEVVDELVRGVDPDEELELAKRAAQRLIHAHREDSPAHGRDLVLAALVRRGYPPGLARAAYNAASASDLD